MGLNLYRGFDSHRLRQNEKAPSGAFLFWRGHFLRKRPLTFRSTLSGSRPSTMLTTFAPHLDYEKTAGARHSFDPALRMYRGTRIRRRPPYVPAGTSQEGPLLRQRRIRGRPCQPVVSGSWYDRLPIGLHRRFMSRLICILLMLLLPLQGFAMQVGVRAQGEVSSLAHEIEHAEGVSHHHDADGSVHYDDSEESKTHLSDSSAVQVQPGIPAVVVLPLPSAVTGTAVRGVTAFLPEPVPERPQRPPSSSLG
jgi:hypothetical protein